jgi:hypothetical protein
VDAAPLDLDVLAARVAIALVAARVADLVVVVAELASLDLVALAGRGVVLEVVADLVVAELVCRRRAAPPPARRAPHPQRRAAQADRAAEGADSRSTPQAPRTLSARTRQSNRGALAGRGARGPGARPPRSGWTSPRRCSARARCARCSRLRRRWRRSTAALVFGEALVRGGDDRGGGTGVPGGMTRQVRAEAALVAIRARHGGDPGRDRQR